MKGKCMADGVIKLTEGVIGSGKTCCCVRMLVDDFLPNQAGLFITNIPIYPDKIAEYMAKKKGGGGKDEILRRLVLIPEEILEEWREGIPGNEKVKQYLTGLDLDGAWILLDEAQFFFGTDKSKEWLGEVKNFGSVIRHYGATLDLVTQAENMIALEVRHLVAQSRVIIPNEGRRLPYLKIRIGDLYELWAKCGYEYQAASAMQERIKVGKKWINQGHPVMMYRAPEIFALYNSHGAVNADKKRSPQFEYQKRSWPSLLKWFWKRNWFHLGKCVSILLLGIWMLLCGGLPKVLKFVTGHIAGSIVNVNMAATPGADTEAETVKEARPAVEKDAAASPEQMKAIIDNYQIMTDGLQARIMSSRTAAERAEHTLKKTLEREEQNAGIVAALEDSLMFASGEIIKIGEGVRYGKYQGRMLEKVDLRRREAHFIGGLVLRIGRLPGRPDENPGGVPGVQGSVPNPGRGDGNDNAKPGRPTPRRAD